MCCNSATLEYWVVTIRKVHKTCDLAEAQFCAVWKWAVRVGWDRFSDAFLHILAFLRARPAQVRCFTVTMSRRTAPGLAARTTKLGVSTFFSAWWRSYQERNKLPEHVWNPHDLDFQLVRLEQVSRWVSWGKMPAGWCRPSPRRGTRCNHDRHGKQQWPPGEAVDVGQGERFHRRDAHAWGSGGSAMANLIRIGSNLGDLFKIQIWKR